MKKKSRKRVRKRDLAEVPSESLADILIIDVFKQKQGE